ncbi:MAG: phosphoribosylformylglycinamidine synthase subunit PurS [Epsilonproteobacteria bacterium]|nr:phosphoribosylformylglycinamidine synthase subunit PurS [Campylobacterota bacterium]
MKVVANIYLKAGVLDPQGKAVHHGLDALGFDGVKDVRVGKQIVIELDKQDEQEALEEVKQMCEKLLANTVIENYEVEVKK